MYKPEYVEQARKLAEFGATVYEIGQFFNVDETTIWRWSQQHEDFCSAIKVGKEAADNRVEQSLYRRAMGYTHDTVKIFQYEGEPVIVPYTEHIPPETTAAIFWLKNRRRDRWRDFKAVELSGEDGKDIRISSTTTVDVGKLTSDQLKALEGLLAVASADQSDTSAA